MLEPLLTRIRDLERANRRWKTICAILATILLAVLTTGTGFFVFLGHRSLLAQRDAMMAAEEARAQEAVARVEAERAVQQANQAIKDFQDQAKKE
jgi:hypothetical protein